MSSDFLGGIVVRICCSMAVHDNDYDSEENYDGVPSAKSELVLKYRRHVPFRVMLPQCYAKSKSVDGNSIAWTEIWAHFILAIANTTHARLCSFYFQIRRKTSEIIQSYPTKK